MDWFEALISLLVASVLIGGLIIWGMAIQNDKELQKDFNRSIVACVVSGENPLACRSGLVRR